MSAVDSMAQTRHIEMREGEHWSDVADSFMGWCLQEKKLSRGGCHEGDPVAFGDGRRYAAVSIPDHSPDLLTLVHEWAVREGRSIRVE
jgi:hypothetical protein